MKHERSRNGDPGGPPSGDGKHLWQARYWTQGSGPNSGRIWAAAEPGRQGFTAAEADAVVRGLVQGVDLHQDRPDADAVNIDERSPEKRAALDRFNLAVAGDA
ncbi:hypothetical protein ACIA5A_18775 [Micromonospora sp. NPDC051300]|uniref:hypothetical protein n=1 Tax=Micromonospora sp. NPDC051300 TaxID=3364286 RepID=UPI00379CD82E